jgi:hypothetical protein
MANYAARINLYKAIEKRRDSKILCYVTGDRRGLETQIGTDAIDVLVDHLDKIGPTPRITFILHTNGGDSMAAWTVVNLVHQFCKELEVLIPRKALSAGTMIALGAHRIIMTKQALLSPIDPSINTHLNPQIEGAPLTSRMPVSVEAVQGYIDLARETLRIKGQSQLAPVLLQLAEKIHPLVLGQVFRTRPQIRFLADRLLTQQKIRGRKAKKIIAFLSSESGSHDYTINRREAASLGLTVDKPDDDLYSHIRNLYESIRSELLLSNPYNQNQILGKTTSAPYSLIRGLIESVDGGSYQFVSEGMLTKTQVPVAPGLFQNAISDERQFEGWKKQ